MVLHDIMLHQNTKLYGISALCELQKFETFNDRRMRKGRRFSMEATQMLLHVFSNNSRPSISEIRDLSHKLNVPEKSVSTWFKNKRTKSTKAIKSPTSSNDGTVNESHHHMESITMTPDHPFYNLSWSSANQPSSNIQSDNEPTSPLQRVPRKSASTDSFSRKRKYSSSIEEESSERIIKRKTYTDFSIRNILQIP